MTIRFRTIPFLKNADTCLKSISPNQARERGLRRGKGTAEASEINLKIAANYLSGKSVLMDKKGKK